MSPVYLAHSLVVYRVEKSHVADVVYLTHSLVVHRVPYTLQENEVSKTQTCDFSTLFTTKE
jgi:hypothetical protein